MENSKNERLLEESQNRNSSNVNNPILSIIIVSYLSRTELPACLGSIPEMILDRVVEVFVIDNSLNSDGCKTLTDQFKHVSYILPPSNLGFGKANNLGYRQSKGEYVLFLNPDTILRKEALLLCLNRLIHESGIGLISPKLLTADGNMDLACRRSIPTIWDGFCRASGLSRMFPKKKLFTGYNLNYLDENDSYRVGAINGAFMMTRRECLEKVGLFDENFFMYGDDLDLCYRFSRAGYDIVYDGSEWITHLKGVSVAKDHQKMKEAIFDANCEFYLKHFNPKNHWFIRTKYRTTFFFWKHFSIFCSKLTGRKKVKPV